MKDSSKDQTDISNFLIDCFNVLKTYGKTSDQLESIVRMHLLVLADCPADEIKKAYISWIKNHAEMPTPAEIFEIVKKNWTMTADEMAAYKEKLKRM